MPVNLFQKIIINRTISASAPMLSSGVLLGDSGSTNDLLIHLLETSAGNFARAAAPVTIIAPRVIGIADDPGWYFLEHAVEREFIIDGVTDWGDPPTAEGSTDALYFHSNWFNRMRDLRYGQFDNCISTLRGIY